MNLKDGIPAILVKYLKQSNLESYDVVITFGSVNGTFCSTTVKPPLTDTPHKRTLSRGSSHRQTLHF